MDCWFYSVGGVYRLNFASTRGGGFARDDSPVSYPYRTPRMPDQDRMWYAAGLTWAVSEKFSVDASYAYIDLVDTPEIDILSSSRSRLTGSYDGGAHLFGVSAQYRF
jgi:long-chain fatty acid transport protein